MVDFPLWKRGIEGDLQRRYQPDSRSQVVFKSLQPPFSKGRSQLGKFAQRSVATNRYRCWNSLSSTQLAPHSSVSLTSPFGKGGSRGICSAGINPIPVHQLFSNPSQPPFSKGRSRLGKFAQRSVATNRYRCWTSLSITCSIFATVVDFPLWKRGIEGDLQRRYELDSRLSVVSNPSQPPFSKGRSRLGKFAQRSVATNRYRCWTSLSTTQPEVCAHPRLRRGRWVSGKLGFATLDPTYSLCEPTMRRSY